MDPMEALRRIKGIIRMIELTDDVIIIRKYYKEIIELTDRGLSGNVIPLHKKF